VLAATLSVAACGGKSVALDQESGVELAAGGASGDGDVVRNSAGVYLLRVDDERLYWVSGLTITSCLKERCASSLVNYVTLDAITEGQQPWTAWIAPQGGDLLWATNTGVYSCPRNGCDGEPHRLGTHRVQADYAVDDAAIVALRGGEGIFTMPRSGGEWSLLVPRNVSYPGVIALHAGYVYWAETDPDSSDTVLLRMAEQGDAEVQTLGHFQGGGLNTNLAFDSSFVYFTDMRQAGAVLRCPLDGCTDAPESVFGPIREPHGLAVDDAGACVLYAHDTESDLVGCATPPSSPLRQLFSSAVEVVMDSDYIYGVHNHAHPGGPQQVLDLYDISRWAR
jgi:hypothetical protein